MCYGMLKGGAGDSGGAGVFFEGGVFFSEGRGRAAFFCRAGGVLAGLAGFMTYAATYQGVVCLRRAVGGVCDL